MIFRRFMSWGHRRRLAVGGAVAVAAVLGGWIGIQVLTSRELVFWNAGFRNETGERAALVHVFERSAASMDGLGQIIRSRVPGLLPLAESYTARWMVDWRYIYVVDDIPVRSLLPANTLEVAGEHKAGTLMTRITLLPAGRLRFSWALCTAGTCDSRYECDEDFEGSAEFQGRLEARIREATVRQATPGHPVGN